MSSNYIMRYAVKTDVMRIMNFIKIYWNENHILANHREFFEYEFLNSIDNVNFVIVENKETYDIEAILGYIEYGRVEQDIMTVMWKSKRNSNPFLGVELLEFLIQSKKFRIVASCGINKKTIGIYDYLGYHTGELEHYYRIARRRTYRVAKILEPIDQTVRMKKEYKLIRIQTFDELLSVFDFQNYTALKPKPYKESWYIQKRYYNHPVYEYEVYGIKNKIDKVDAILFMRKIEVNGIKILRIIDFIGNVEDLNFISQEIEELLQKNDYEYIDIYQHGISKEILNHAGFTSKSDTKNIIPNYFEPYVVENVSINYFTTDENVILFKGDGDQDRPNRFKRR